MDFIDIKELCYKKILREINLNFGRGKIYAIVGPNGSGKTTLIKHIIKYLEGDRGSIYINGENLSKLKAIKLAENISYVPQNTNLELDFNCFDIVMMGRSYKIKAFSSETKEDFDIVNKAMEITDTLKLKDKHITEISGGERQRVILARAIAQQANCILLDEPLANLDIRHQLETLEHLKVLRNEGKTIIVVLHDINQALMYSDELILMNGGSVHSVGDPEKVINSKTINEVYGVDCEIVPFKEKRHIIFIPKGKGAIT